MAPARNNITIRFKVKKKNHGHVKATVNPKIYLGHHSAHILQKAKLL